MNYRQIMTQDELRRIFEYRDGNLYWKPNPKKTKTWNICHAGKVAGGWTNGCRSIVFRPSAAHPFARITLILAHRLIFCLHHGHYPEMVDHINGDPADNRIENLRAAEPYQNSANAKTYSTNKTGYRGVHRVKKNGKFYATFSFKRKRHFVGEFDTPELASAAYEAAASAVRGEWHRA